MNNYTFPNKLGELEPRLVFNISHAQLLLSSSAQRVRGSEIHGKTDNQPFHHEHTREIL